MKFFKFIVGIICIILVVGYGIALLKFFGEIDFGNIQLKYFIYGFIVFLKLWLFWLRKAHFFSTFEHELTHLIVALLFLKKPKGFLVTDERGGATAVYGSNFLIALAPYFLPTLVLIMLPFYLIINPEFYSYYFGALGFFSSYHFLSTLQEFSYKQPDISETGRIFSTIFLVFANIFVIGFLLSFVIGDFSEGVSFIKEGWHVSFLWASSIVKSNFLRR